MEVNIIVKGKVQGVYFRAFVKKSADQFNICGYVKNLANGELLIVANGDSENMRRFIGACKCCPPGSRIDDFSISKAGSESIFDSFEIIK